MKVRLVFVRNGTAQYSNDDYAMEKQCKTVDVELPITNDDARKTPIQVIGRLLDMKKQEKEKEKGYEEYKSKR